MLGPSLPSVCPVEAAVAPFESELGRDESCVYRAIHASDSKCRRHPAHAHRSQRDGWVVSLGVDCCCRFRLRVGAVRSFEGRWHL